MFNAVRETSDHGLVNSWDRTPYLTTQAGNGPSLDPHWSYIHHNALYNNYNSFYPIDHDDGSCFYEDSYNVQVYGGKKNYLGHHKTDHHELYIYPDVKDSQGPGVCIADQAPIPGFAGYNEVWTDNRCVMYATGSVYNIWDCDVAQLFTPLLEHNVFYIPDGYNATFNCRVGDADVGLTLEEWQSYGEDIDSRVEPAPSVDVIIQWGREMLIE